MVVRFQYPIGATMVSETRRTLCTFCRVLFLRRNNRRVLSSPCAKSHVLLVPFFAALALFSRNFYSESECRYSLIILPQRLNRIERQRRDGHLFTFFLFLKKKLKTRASYLLLAERCCLSCWSANSCRWRQGRAAIPPGRSLGCSTPVFAFWPIHPYCREQ